jgi:hypothetical protein
MLSPMLLAITLEAGSNPIAYTNAGGGEHQRASHNPEQGILEHGVKDT